MATDPVTIDLLQPLKWMGVFLVGVFALYLIGRVLSAAIFRSWFEAKIQYFRRSKHGDTDSKTDGP